MRGFYERAPERSSGPSDRQLDVVVRLLRAWPSRTAFELAAIAAAIDAVGGQARAADVWARDVLLALAELERRGRACAHGGPGTSATWRTWTLVDPAREFAGVGGP